MGKGKALLRVLRASHEPSLTQTTLARAAGLKRLRYWAIENGESEPNDDEKAAIAVALNVKVADIAWPSSGLKRTA